MCYTRTIAAVTIIENHDHDRATPDRTLILFLSDSIVPSWQGKELYAVIMGRKMCWMRAGFIYAFLADRCLFVSGH